MAMDSDFLFNSVDPSNSKQHPSCSVLLAQFCGSRLTDRLFDVASIWWAFHIGIRLRTTLSNRVLEEPSVDALMDSANPKLSVIFFGR